MTTLILHIVVALLALVGLGCCGVFYLQEHGAGKASKAAHDVICDGDSCSLLTTTKYHHLLGVPNWWFGTAFYVCLIASLFFVSPLVSTLAIAATVGANLFSIFLIWSLVFKLKIVCRVCYTAHAVNMSILILLLVQHFRG